MQKIKLMTDSACDVPVEMAAGLGVTVLPIPITHGDKTYHERVELTNDEFYSLLLSSNEVPSTAHITPDTYIEEYKKYYDMGYTHVINITINSLGSGMYDASCLARRRFYAEYGIDEKSFPIAVVDSKAYTMGYGIAIIKAAEMINGGRDYESVLAYLDDWFSRVEVLFSVFSLDFAKKSGRISGAAAFVGELLGLRPMFVFVDGVSTVIDKVRGDKMVVPRILEIAKKRMRDPEKYPLVMIRGCNPKEAEELEKLIRQTLPDVSFEGVYSVGASVAINSGPKVLSLIYAGEKRVRS